MKEAVCKRTAELLVEEDEEQSDLAEGGQNGFVDLASCPAGCHRAAVRQHFHQAFPWMGKLRMTMKLRQYSIWLMA